MAQFKFKARDAHGTLQSGIREGSSREAIADQLAHAGWFPVEITPSRANDTPLKFDLPFLKPTIPTQEVEIFCRSMSTLLKAGVPILRALTGIQSSSQTPAFAHLVGQIRGHLESGQELSSALHQHPTVFSPYFVSMVRVGEMTGTLENIFLRLYQHLEFEKATRERVRTALRYPSFVLTAMAVAMVILNIVVLPTFAQVFAGLNTELPWMTRLLLKSSHAMVTYWPWLLASIVGLVFAYRAWVAQTEGRYQHDRGLLKLPIVGPIVHKATLARFARSFALASRSGVPIVQALNAVAETVGNAYIGRRIAQMRDSIEHGDNLINAAVITGIFTPTALQMLAVGEESGSLDDMIDEVARLYEQEVDYAIKSLGAQIEPILIAGLGVMVLVLALGVFMPMWDMGQAALRK